MGYMVEDFHIINILNIRGMQKNLSSMSPAEKNRSLETIVDILIQQITPMFFTVIITNQIPFYFTQ